jgi:hypothetical protein
MYPVTLTDREVETLILALKYWRHHRRGETRRTDNLLSPHQIEVLLAKLGCSALSTLPPDDLPVDIFPR